MPRQERSIRTQALILKRRDFGEADRLLTMLTPNHGKIEGIAKGARKPTSTKTGHVELFTRADMLINKGRDLDIVAQAVMLEPYLPLREDLQRGAYASYVTEMLIKFTVDASADDSDERLFNLLDATFKRLCEDDDPRLVVRYFEMRLLDLTGFRPELNECVISHEEIKPVDQFFSYSMGGVISPGAVHLSPGHTMISLNALKLLRHMQRSSYEHVRTLNINISLHTEVERIMNGYITYLLENPLKSVDFIRRVRDSRG